MSDPERAARRHLGSTTTAVDLIQPVRKGKLQLPSALLPPEDLQAETLEAQGARRFGILLIPESVSRFPAFAAGAEWRGPPDGARGRLGLTTRPSIRSVEIELLLGRSFKGSGSHSVLLARMSCTGRARERTEGESQGVVSRVTPAEIFVTVSGQERRLTEDTVTWIHRSPDPVWDGAASGAALGLPLGLIGAAFGDGIAAFAFVGGGAAIGAAIDASVRGKHLVYGKPPGFSFLRRPVPALSLGDLWSLVAPGQSIRVRDASLGDRRGRFIKASRDALTIEIDSNVVVIPAERVQLVRRRSFISARWIGFGMGIGGMVGFVKKHDEYNRHATREDVAGGVFLGGLAGLLSGTRYTDIYRPATTTATVIAVRPLLGPGRNGAVLSVEF